MAGRDFRFIQDYQKETTHLIGVASQWRQCFSAKENDHVRNRSRRGRGYCRTIGRSRMRTLPTLRKPRTEEVARAPESLPVSAPVVHRLVRLAGAVVLAGIAAAIAWHGVHINQWYGRSLGKTDEASTLLGGLAMCADALALTLPSAALALWADRRRTVAAAAWAVWGVVLVFTMLATIGFASVNIADTTAARTRVANQGAGLTQRVAQLRTERAAILETRAVAAIEAEVQRAQPRVPADTWRDTRRCTDVTVREVGSGV